MLGSMTSQKPSWSPSSMALERSTSESTAKRARCSPATRAETWWPVCRHTAHASKRIGHLLADDSPPRAPRSMTWIVSLRSPSDEKSSTAPSSRTKRGLIFCLSSKSSVPGLTYLTSTTPAMSANCAELYKPSSVFLRSLTYCLTKATDLDSAGDHSSPDSASSRSSSSGREATTVPAFTPSRRRSISAHVGSGGMTAFRLMKATGSREFVSSLCRTKRRTVKRARRAFSYSSSVTCRTFLPKVPCVSLTLRFLGTWSGLMISGNKQNQSSKVSLGARPATSGCSSSPLLRRTSLNFTRPSTSKSVKRNSTTAEQPTRNAYISKVMPSTKTRLSKYGALNFLVSSLASTALTHDTEPL
mmetsp:Transcript_47723/g.125953  ORF Transcript_47723/g.125953 Transcript_47723/m.125953 type:complete len:358 (-) Transcript_47723:1079-2152(-)